MSWLWKALVHFYSKLPFLKPSKFSKWVIFENFLEEVREVRASLLTTEDGQPLSSSLWFRSKYKANLAVDQEVYLVTSFCFYIALLNHNSTLEVSKEFDFFVYCWIHSASRRSAPKLHKWPPNPMRRVREWLQLQHRRCPTFLALKEQLVPQEKFIHNLQRNLDDYRQKIQTLEAELRGDLAKPSSFRVTDTQPHDGRSTLNKISEWPTYTSGKKSENECQTKRVTFLKSSRM